MCGERALDYGRFQWSRTMGLRLSRSEAGKQPSSARAVRSEVQNKDRDRQVLRWHRSVPEQIIRGNDEQPQINGYTGME